MIVVDTEFTSFDFNKGGLWQIGALELEKPSNQFLQEARLDDEDTAEKGALEVVGKTEEELRDKKRQSQKEMLNSFFRWIKDIRIKNLIFQGQWDFGYILTKAGKYGLEIPFHYRSFDLHSIAQARYMDIENKLLIEGDHSGMGLPKVLEFCGMPDSRRIIGDRGDVIKIGTAHNALEDAKLTGECFSRLIYGKNLFSEYSKYKIPKELAK
ncbi:hypothetical protein A3K82_03500 [Candidatus Pacearchaeota archaeon RBG_19FT_COMBO_34_9]|nr:MAG: hypothetical protein A3K82_03500 [Candidatus Pacearchaeota archaeon RBG_19FT_COMBO_34_9]OGJ16172.1 MAG: hypothetical protein A3K74_03015 [Candidatus Pacearchaeota archaeon RBG_13_33_26]